MRLIVISPPEDLPNEPDTVCRVLDQTPATFHLRKPDQGDGQLADYLKRIPAHRHPRIMVHGHRDLLSRFNLKGIHFSERERAGCPEGLRRLRRERPGCCLSTSFHRIADIPAHHGRFDYILLSPIFDSISKKDYPAAFDHGALKRFLAKTGHTVVALGGLNARRAATAASLGFRGIAVIGAVWGAADPEQAAGRLSAACCGLSVFAVRGAPGR